MTRASGLSIVEILVVLAMVVLLAGVTTVISTRALQNAEFDRIRELVRSELIAAQTDTIAGTNDSAWGVSFTSDTITRYSGSSYATRNTALDRITSFTNSSIMLMGTLEISFVRPSGVPLTGGTITITDGTSIAITTVTNAGAIEVQ